MTGPRVKKEDRTNADKRRGHSGVCTQFPGIKLDDAMLWPDPSKRGAGRKSDSKSSPKPQAEGGVMDAMEWPEPSNSGPKRKRIERPKRTVQEEIVLNILTSDSRLDEEARDIIAGMVVRRVYDIPEINNVRDISEEDMLKRTRADLITNNLLRIRGIITDVVDEYLKTKETTQAK